MSDPNPLTVIQQTSNLAVMTPDDIARANYDVLRRAGRKESTRAQYKQTEDQWAAWCAAQALSPTNFEIVYIDAFFQSIKDRYSRTTLQNMLSHLRKSVEAIAASSDETAAIYMRQLQAMKQYKIDSEWGGTNPRKRGGKRIDTSVVWEAIHAQAKSELLTERNKAFYALLFFAGLRREELRQLKWQNVDFGRSVIKVVGGKKRQKNEFDEIPMLGELKAILQKWQAEQTTAAGGQKRVYVVSAIRKGGHIGKDKPIASGSIYELLTGYDAMPHDARHTLVTNLLDKGVALHNAQTIARHRKGSTTMHYAHALEPEKLARIIPSPY